MKPVRTASPFLAFTLPLAFAVTLLAGGCSKQAPQAAPQTSQTAPNAAGQQAINPNTAPVQQPAPQTATVQQPSSGSYATPPADNSRSDSPRRSRSSGSADRAPEREQERASYTIPAGTHITITTGEELGSKISQSGQSFSATVDTPIVVRGVTLVPSGSPATGTVVDAKTRGRFKGSGELDLRLDTIRAHGHEYQVETSSIERVEKGKGKRTAVMAGGGGGLGALIGGLAGGGKGALIGGLVGAGGGTAGAAFTGNKQVVIPAETRLTFRLEQSVTVSR